MFSRAISSSMLSLGSVLSSGSMPPPGGVEPLLTVSDIARIFAIEVQTVYNTLSKYPERLPKSLPFPGKLRWLPQGVRDFFSQFEGVTKVQNGRKLSPFERLKKSRGRPRRNP